ncbi:MAG: multicopper oxidase domain-containing protein [Chloroflexi bacterium]|nr:multicopper oxidase domain-containing protein [Chloroflexota bacterium]
MFKHKFINSLNSILIIASLLLGGITGQASAQNIQLTQKNANLALAPDPSIVPHYFGPFPNYANSPLTQPDAQVNITGSGTGALASATVDPATGSISAIAIMAPGSGYTSAPTVTITGSGSSATASAVVDYSGVVNAITVDLPGAGYSTPAVTITGGGATSDATATATGGVDSLTLTNGGSGFTLQPMVEISKPNDPAGTQATASATMDAATGVVNSVTIVVAGSGYTSAPTVTITDGMGPNFGGGSGATVTATLSITGISLNPNSFGSGYVSAPIVDITDTTGTGAGASATATITTSGGSITSLSLINPGTGYLTPGIKKFVDTLPGLTPAGANNLGQYIPVAVADTSTYPGTDYYEIAVVQYRMKMHSSLPPTLLRGYVQLATGVVPGAHVNLSNANLNGPDTAINGYFGVDQPHYLGPTIIATKDRPVRILFRNLLPTGVKGDLFIPVDTTVMGSGMGPLSNMPAPLDQGSVNDEVRNPMCNQGFNAGNPDLCYTQNRATLHLHGGITPWISDGTPHQWITPAGENTSYPEGVSVSNVPDMPDPGPGAQTFFYTNQQSARLMFYHDHSWGITRLNVYAGEAAGYVLTDAAEAALMAGPLAGLGYGIPLIIQDKTFVPDAAQLAQEDPTWNTSLWGGKGSLWVPHVMMPAQNPGSSTGQSDFGRWMYGPYFWPPATPKFGPIANPYFDPNCDSQVILPDGSNQFCEPPLIPGVPNVSVGMEAFNDTPVVNGTAYPTTTLDPKSYRFRILNAANDRFWNLQWYVADPRTGTLSEVALNPSDLAIAQTNPDVVPQPDLAFSPAGPDWVQIGTEGGFLPAPTVISGHQPTTWIINPTRFDVGNVDKHSLLLAPAERGDVIVDFSKYAGKTLILYNDAPAAFPARVAGYDYYTGDPDMTGSGGAPTTLPGYGPNTRTIMQVKIAASTPAQAFNMAPLNAAFAHHLDASGKPAGVFESSEDPIVVGQGAYNSAYGTTFRTLAPRDGFARINDMSLTFNTLLNGALGATMTMPFENKGIHDEMNSAVFDEYGRMSANMGLEAPGATPLTQNIILYPYINPASEIINGIELPSGSLKVTPISTAADGTQIWKITHNGVDTHPLHFHLANVQVINRVTWDNIIIKPDPNELGWKDTVRVSPLEDTIVALRPIVPKSPFGLPDSIRPLNPAMPIGDASGFNNTDALGNPITPGITNQMVNFGWEYVWHCHILGHEEMDMMRPIKLNVSRALPAAPVLSASGGSGAPINLSWTDGTPVDYLNPTTWGDPAGEIGYKIERADGAGNFAPIAQALANATSFSNTGLIPAETYHYRVTAFNAAGKTVSNEVTVLPQFPEAPTNLSAIAISGTQVNLAWTDNATNETGYRIERAEVTAGITGPFAGIATTGINSSTYNDLTAAPLTSYAYQVFAFNLVGDSLLPSNTATVTTPDVAPIAPTNLVATPVSASQIGLTWTDNSNNEIGFRVERATVTGGIPGAFTPIGTVGHITAYSDSDPALTPITIYAYRVFAFNLIGDSLPSNVANATTFDVPPVAPTSLTATAINPGQVNLTWTDNAANETNFRIERTSVTGGTTSTSTFIVAANVTVYNDLTTAPFTTYAYQVIAFNAIGDSLPSNIATVTTPDLIPAAPTGLSAVQNGLQVNMAWTDNANNETSFVVERSINGAGFTTFATIPANTVSYPDTTVIAGSSYAYRVMAKNSGGVSAYSNTVSVTILAAPTSLVATLLSSTRIRLTWIDNATTETGFNVERSTNGGAYVTIVTAPARTGTGSVTYTDNTVLSGNIYSYQVKAINGLNSSAYSNLVSVIDGSTPTAPSNLTATILANPLRVRVSWVDNATNEASFVLERSDNGGPFTLLATLPARNGTGNVNYTDTTAPTGGTYTYRVMAKNGVGSSAYSNTFSVSLIVPASPSNATATVIRNGTTDQVTLNWTDNANNETRFAIERSTNAAFTAVTAYTVNANIVTFQQTTQRARTYYYRIQATNAVGTSTWVTFTPAPIVTP